MLFNITDLLSNIAGEQKDTFYDIVGDLTDKGAGNDNDLRIPNDAKTARQICTQGKYSIYENIPHPTSHIVDGHICVRIKDILKQSLALGVEIAWTYQPDDSSANGYRRETVKIHGCLAMTRLLEKLGIMHDGGVPTWYGYYFLWSDGFQRSWIKQKLNNVWILTITFPNPNGDELSPFHTRTLAIGKGHLDHTAVMDWYANEIKELASGDDYFFGNIKSFKRVKMGLVAYLSDRPEKCSLLREMLLGTFGLRSNWAAVVDCLHLPDCTMCFISRLKQTIADRYSVLKLTTCELCCQWDMVSSSPALKKVAPQTAYPSACHPESPEVPLGREPGIHCILPVKQTFAWFRSVFAFASFNVKMGTWGKGKLLAYMRSCAISASVIDKVWSVNKSTTVEESEQIPIDEGEIADGFQVMSKSSSGLPVIWTWDVLSDVFLDCGMHLVFHGVVANIVEVAHQFMADHGLASEFMRMVNPYMLDIATLRLDWCHMKLLPKSQWLAEDELGLSRILPFIYGQFFLNLADKTKNSDTTSKTLHALAQVFHSLHVTACMLMTPPDSLVKLIDVHVKLCLSCCDCFVKSYKEKGMIPFWSTKGNYLSLLNLAEA